MLLAYDVEKPLCSKKNNRGKLTQEQCAGNPEAVKGSTYICTSAGVIIYATMAVIQDLITLKDILVAVTVSSF